MTTARRRPGSHTWLRVLVVLLAVLGPAAPAQFAEFAAPPAAASETLEYDVPDTPLRTASCCHRPATPPRPAPLPPGGPAPRPLSSPPHHRPHLLTALRTVVLRC
ncbi:hypothetical protein PYK79_21345 [Streptomyces sp. ID05-04B]|uniref:hypothetical protein n=1 Tax=unclassified Streptomyces TaxID=2593676 RepID=UPI000D1ACF56|nr:MULTISPECIES: hypothetical protein [unclassified Streptomyces]AVV41500.1 hypothetical protein C6376_08675 [Streptomyces sp. P3]MDX5565358.1 hypothetical protein [Streptomyces sp. ID05-04B]